MTEVADFLAVQRLGERRGACEICHGWVSAFVLADDLPDVAFAVFVLERQDHAEANHAFSTLFRLGDFELLLAACGPVAKVRETSAIFSAVGFPPRPWAKSSPQGWGEFGIDLGHPAAGVNQICVGADGRVADVISSRSRRPVRS